MKKFSHINALYQVVRYVEVTNENPDCPEKYKIRKPIRYRGTVKIDGTNAGVRCTADKLQAQSRDRFLYINGTNPGEETDNAGFALFVSGEAQTSALHAIEAQVRQAAGLPDDAIVTLFGEWCGPGIQRGSSVATLPDKQLVLFAVATGEGEEAEYLDVLPQLGDTYADARIYSILDAPTWEVTIDLTSADTARETAAFLEEVLSVVETQCPWAAKFGIERAGEGIVWIPMDPEYRNRSDLFFKTKGEKHKNTGTKQRVEIDAETLAGIEEFVDFAVTSNRLEQGLHVLRERGLPVDMSSIGVYLKWLVGDVERECKDDLEESGLEWSQVSKPVLAKARDFYLALVKQGL